MPEENKNDFSEEIKPLVKGVVEALADLRTLLVAIVAFVIFAIEKLAVVFADWRSRAKESKPAANQSQVTSNESKERTKEFKSPTDEFPRNTGNGLKGMKMQSIEVPKQLSSFQEEQTRLFSELAKDYAYPALALISTIALVVGVARLGPVSDWSRKQNECVENATSFGRKGK